MAHRPSEVLAARLPVLRDTNGWSQQDLADRLAELGYPLGRVAVAKIEGGSRGVSLDDAVAIAAAFDVPLPLLVLPVHTAKGAALVAPRLEVKAWDAFDWMVGQTPLLDVHAWSRHTGLVRAYERLVSTQDAAKTAAYRLESAETLGWDHDRQLKAWVDALRDLATAVRDLSEAGGDPRPLVDRGLAKALRDGKIDPRPRRVVTFTESEEN